MPWWGQLQPVLELGEYSFVRLVDLSQTSFYFPWQLLRQFGWAQVVPPRTSNFFPVEDLTERLRLLL